MSCSYGSGMVLLSKTVIWRNINKTGYLIIRFNYNTQLKRTVNIRFYEIRNFKIYVVVELR